MKADGKIVVGGGFTSIGGVARDYIALLDPDGSLDKGFDPNLNHSVFSMAVQGDGKIVVGGGFTSIGGVTRNNIARLNPDGSLDTSFNLLLNADGIIQSIAVQGDGKILIGGHFRALWPLGEPAIYIARLNSDGTTDISFRLNPSGPVSSIAVQGDGKILIGGSFTSINKVTRKGIARLNPDGSF